MIKLLNRQNVYELFPELSKGLSRAFENTSIGSYWDFDSLFQHIINFEVYAFIDDSSGYCGVFEVCQSPRTRTLNFFWSGKHLDNTTPVDWDYIDSFLQHAARDLRCQVIQCEGRVGWKKILENRGYTMDSAIYTKGVSYEYDVLPPVPPAGNEGEG